MASDAAAAPAAHAGVSPSAADLLHWADHGQPWPDSVGRPAFADIASAYQTALQLRALRLARGEQPRGYKIGFTNRHIWPVYQVFAPIWGTVWDSTLAFTDATGAGAISLAATCQPRLEPELVFAFRTTPPLGADVQALFESLDWLAPGVEIVQSHRPGWRFAAAAETVADGALHARLLVGPRIALRDFAADAAALQRQLADADLTLIGPGGQAAEAGRGAHVLDNPLLALHHFLTELRQCPGAPDVQPGDVVTTGTWTDAWPVAAGERWLVRYSAPLGTLDIRFS